jgi:hypothetical protein
MIAEEAEPRRQSRRRLRLALGAVGLAVFAACFAVLLWGDDILGLATSRYFGAPPPPPGFGKPADRAEADRQDLEYLGQFASLEAGLTPESRAAFESDRRALIARAGQMKPAELVLGVAHAVARAGHPDSRLELSRNTPGLSQLPIRFAWFAEGLYVIAAAPGREALLGARIVSGFKPYSGGGTTGSQRQAVLPLVASPAALTLTWPELPADSAELSLTMPDGTTQKLALPAGSGPSGPERQLLVDAVPLSLLEPERAFFARLVGDGLYLRLDRALDDGPVAPKLAAGFAAFGAGGMRWAVLDLRWAAGSDYAGLATPIRGLQRPLSPGGRLFVLTGSQTGAMGMAVAAWAKDAAGDRVVIEGEPSAEGLRFWSAEGPPLVLPNSGLEIDFATAYHDWAEGCRSLRCYWPDLAYGVAVHDLGPDVVVKWRFEDYRQGVDTILRRLSEMVRTQELAWVYRPKPRAGS